MNLQEFLLFCFLGLIKLLKADAAEVTVKTSQGAEIVSLHARLAAFSSSIPDGRLVGYLVRARPINACSTLSLTTVNPDIALWMKPKILLAQQGPCSYIDQVRRAELAGFVGVIIFSNSSDELVLMDSNTMENSSIPAVFIGQMDGILLWDKYAWTTGYYAVISEERTKMTVAWELILILIPVSIVVIPLSAIIVITLVAGRCPLFLTAYRHAKKRTRLVSRLPERRFAREDAVEDGPGCSICLEYYKAADKIRKILPCGHEFHSACVDPWLLQDHLACPLCRHEVRNERDQSGAGKHDLLQRIRIYAIPLHIFSFPSLHGRSLHFPGAVVRVPNQAHIV